MKRNANALPRFEAHRVARARSRRPPQRPARSKRPPSSGNAGIRLNSASARLTSAKLPHSPPWSAIPARPPAFGWRARAIAARHPAMSRLASGPATAMRNSWAGFCASPPICATPPKMNRVMRRASMPCARACARLLDGRQAIMLRKGGIDEKGFWVDADEFLLYPTYFHQMAEKVRPEFADETTALLAAPPPEGVLRMSSVARVVDHIEVARPEGMASLEDLHPYNDEQVSMRLEFRPKKPLVILVVEVRPTL